VARTKRIYFPGALLHVFNRGNEKKSIFLDDIDRMKFLNILKESFSKFNFKIYSYVLMPNHFHFLLEDIDGKLPYIMKYISENYTMYFNYKYKRVGHLFQGRYRSIIVEKIFVKDVARYIILNPIRADIAEKLNDFRWSSYHEYMGMNKKLKITTTDWIFSIFGEDENKALEKFKEFLISSKGVSEEIINDSLFSGIILGTKTFKKEMQKKIKIDEFNLPKKFFKNNVNPEEIIKITAEILNINKLELKNKKGKYNYLKRTSIYIIKEYTNNTLEEIAKMFNSYPTTISRIYNGIKKEKETNHYLKKIINTIENRIGV